MVFVPARILWSRYSSFITFKLVILGLRHEVIYCHIPESSSTIDRSQKPYLKLIYKLLIWIIHAGDTWRYKIKILKCKYNNLRHQAASHNTVRKATLMMQLVMNSVRLVGQISAFNLIKNHNHCLITLTSTNLRLWN